MLSRCCLILFLIISVACGSNDKIVTVSQENLGKGENAVTEESTTNRRNSPAIKPGSSSGQSSGDKDTTDEEALPSAMLMASYLSDCKVVATNIICSIADGFLPQFLDVISLSDKTGSVTLEKPDLIFVFENSLIRISFPQEFDINGMKLGDVEIPLSFGTNEEVEAEAAVPPEAPIISSLTVAAMDISPLYLQKDSTQAIEWSSENSESCEIKFGNNSINANLPPSGQLDFEFTEDGSITLKCINASGESAENSLEIMVLLDPVITNLSVAGESIGPVVVGIGSTHSIAWTSENATKCELRANDSLLSQETSGSVDLGNSK
ncbi:MAG: hypothetical protein HRU09_18250 [Oligoflexales bacterium]|nr:hypothetical protein [Oligoflexales bacterium]